VGCNGRKTNILAHNQVWFLAENYFLRIIILHALSTLDILDSTRHPPPPLHPTHFTRLYVVTVFGETVQIPFCLWKTMSTITRKQPPSLQIILKPVWIYGLQLWGTASNSNLEILERFQSKVLRIIEAPWYMPNTLIKHYLQLPTVK
jgi:hypothetical protein